MSASHQHAINVFSDIAGRKGASLVYDSRAGEVAMAFLDLDLIQASLDHAIEVSRSQGEIGLSDRLDRLRRAGTPVQHVDFVLGGGRTYYFPEDIGKMIDSGPTAGHPFAIRTLSWMRCRPIADGSHAVEEHSIRICLIEEPS